LAKVCLDSNGKEANCYESVESNSPGTYKYFRKKSPLSVDIVGDVSPKHWFVECRGFVYEFGVAAYQELDINDPNYKCGPGRERVVDEEYMEPQGYPTVRFGEYLLGRPKIAYDFRI